MDSPGNRADDGQLNPTAAEVADMRERRKKVKTVDYAAWAATILSVVLGYFFFHWTYSGLSRSSVLYARPEPATFII